MIMVPSGPIMLLLIHNCDLRNVPTIIFTDKFIGIFTVFFESLKTGYKHSLLYVYVLFSELLGSEFTAEIDFFSTGF